MSYEVYTTKTVEKAIARLPGDAHDRMNKAIDALADDPRPPGCKNLGGATATASGSASGGHSTGSTIGRGGSMWSESHTGATSTGAKAPTPHSPGPIGQGIEEGIIHPPGIIDFLYTLGYASPVLYIRSPVA